MSIAILLVGGIAWPLWSFHQRHQNRLTVKNRSGQPVTVLKVTITGETTTFN